MKYSKYDCLDIGADVNSMEWCKTYLGVSKSIGLNIERSRLENMRSAGVPCEEVNAFDIPDDVRVDYIFMSHLLEHLQTAQEVSDLISKCVKMARKGIYVAGPFFEDDTYLRTYALKFVWGDWTNHVSRFGVYNFLPVLRHTLGDKVTTSLGFPIFDSTPDNVVSIDERSDVVSYEKDRTKGKKPITFTRPIFQEYLTFIRIDDTVDANRAHEARHGRHGKASWLLWEQAQVDALRAIHQLRY